MKPVLTAAQMKQADADAINCLGIPSAVLMERAALAVCSEAEAFFPFLRDRRCRVLVLCGSGNNGGDGYAAARILTVRSASPNPTAPLTGSKMRGDRRHNQNSPQNELEKQYQNELEKQYEKRFFEGCGKSLACQNICPAGIRTGDLLAQSTAVALWRRTLGRNPK